MKSASFEGASFEGASFKSAANAPGSPPRPSAFAPGGTAPRLPRTCAPSGVDCPIFSPIKRPSNSKAHASHPCAHLPIIEHHASVLRQTPEFFAKKSEALSDLARKTPGAPPSKGGFTTTLRED
ncbi:hypothetical protein [Lujinxingia sediminis]|uniref:hypothetical protein n=1 Tax=Lujinxingia sediminis TaxID=2480984 RepID=UPI003D3245BD